MRAYAAVFMSSKCRPSQDMPAQPAPAGPGIFNLDLQNSPKGENIYINAPVVWVKGEGRRSKSLCRAGDRIPWRFWEREGCDVCACRLQSGNKTAV